MRGEVQVRGGADLAQPARGLARDPLILAASRFIEHGDPVDPPTGSTRTSGLAVWFARAVLARRSVRRSRMDGDGQRPVGVLGAGRLRVIGPFI